LALLEEKEANKNEDEDDKKDSSEEKEKEEYVKIPFDEEAYVATWIEQNPEPVIPPEVISDKDEDYEIEEVIEDEQE